MPARGRRSDDNPLPEDPTLSESKVLTLREAVARFVRDGDTVVLEGFTHLIPFAAGHEIIRQRRRDLTLVRLTPDLLMDQMVAAGVARGLIFGWLGNPGVGSLHAIRRAVERDYPAPLGIEEYSHFGLLCRYQAAASGLPFFPLRGYRGTDLPAANPNLKQVTCPFTGETLDAVSALHPDVAILNAQRADAEGNTQIWGLVGAQREAAFASRRVIVVVEEVVPEEVVRADPNRTAIPSVVVDAVVEEPWSAHPSFAQGYYDRDNAAYVAWDRITRDSGELERYLDEWVHGIPDRAAYRERLGEDTLRRLRPGQRLAGPVDYGDYR